MSDQKKIEFATNFDDPNNPKVMTITIPIEEVVHDISNSSYVYMRGFFGEMESLAMTIVKNKRMELKRSGAGRILVPPGSDPLRIH